LKVNAGCKIRNKTCRKIKNKKKKFEWRKSLLLKNNRRHKIAYSRHFYKYLFYHIDTISFLLFKKKFEKREKLQPGIFDSEYVEFSVKKKQLIRKLIVLKTNKYKVLKRLKYKKK